MPAKHSLNCLSGKSGGGSLLRQPTPTSSMHKTDLVRATLGHHKQRCHELPKSGELESVAALIMMSQFRHTVSAGDCGVSEEHRRTLTLQELRPFALIGISVPLFPWETRRIKDLSRIKSKATKEFYKHQNEVIDSLEDIDELLDSGIHTNLIEEYGDDIGQESPRQRRRQPLALFSPVNDAENEVRGESRELSQKVVYFWINLNMAANVLLLLGKVSVVLMTDSLSIVASLVDSILDLFSTVIIFISANVADRRDWKTKLLYPVGRNRLEPIGVLVFSIIMILSFIKIAQEALESLFKSPEDSKKIIAIGAPSLIVMIGTVAVKGVLWQLCKHVKSSSVQALSQDALTDCVFNFFSILFPVLSNAFRENRLDPLGALFLAIYVVWSWAETAMEHINNLTGAACTPDERRQLLYMCIRFSERIKYITALNVYHAGDRLMCEVDILLDPSLPMRDAHDLAEALQYALETLRNIERAFVHVDYRRDNFTGHMN